MPTLCLGEALVDLVCERPVGGLAEADAFVPHFGGAVANAAVMADRRGGEVALAGGAGEGAWGRWLQARLRDEGVGLEFLALVDSAPTPVAFLAVDDRGEPDTTGAGDVLTGVLIAALQQPGHDPTAIATALPDAVAESARATERWGALE